jgi:glycosyltransferase involved in cell wall biosynthesis/2-polyprenyl-3-methyl-5-hydroxy-6-metoxy-1,4-benzoquinol methylase
VKPDQVVSVWAVRELVREALDSMDITDVVYHDFEHSTPLVEDVVFQLLNRVDRGSSVLAIGANGLLAKSILAAGYDLTLWRFGQSLLPAELGAHVGGAITAEDLASGAVPSIEARYDALVLPRVFEHVPADPDVVIKTLLPNLRRDGIIFVATRNLASLHVRVRSALGKSFLPGFGPPDVLFSMNWPDLHVRRYYLRDELLKYVRAAGLVPVHVGFSVAFTPYNGSEYFGLRGYAARELKHWIKRALPSMRDYVTLTLRRPTAEERRSGFVASGGEAPVDDTPVERPFASVILPTRNRSAMLADSLSGFLQQTYPSTRFEVVVVNDGSSDGTEQVVREFAAIAPFDVRHVDGGGRGAIAARNLGMREARGEIVAHLDDDCRPSPEWLEEGVRGFTPGVAVVGGPIYLKPEQHVSFFNFAVTYVEEMGMYPTANIFYRRDVALGAGGFDATFGRNVMGRPVAGWDSDLAWRLRRAGHRTRFRRGAVAYQEVFRLTPRQWLLDGWRAITLPMAVKRVPEIGWYLFFHRIFAQRLNFYYDLFLAGIVLALIARHPAALLLGLPWALWCLGQSNHDRWPPTRWWRLAAKIALLHLRQGIVLAALALGSVRARRLLI